MTNAIAKVALIVLVSLFAACGGEEPASGPSNHEALTVSPADPAPAEPAKPTCVAGKKYGECTCQDGGNGHTCTGGTCMNCDPNQTPDGSNPACHCDNSTATPVSPMPVAPATVPTPCDVKPFTCGY